MSDPATILARLKALTGSDREVDYEIAGALFRLSRVSKELERSLGYHPGGIEPQMIVERRFGPDTEPIPHWTASIDAALALVEKVASTKAEEILQTAISYINDRGLWPFSRWLPLAILIALFTHLSDARPALKPVSIVTADHFGGEHGG